MKNCKGCGKEFRESEHNPTQEYCDGKCRHSAYMKTYNKEGKRRRSALEKTPCPLCLSLTNKWFRNDEWNKVCQTCDRRLKAGQPIAEPLYNEQGGMFHGKSWWIGRRFGKFTVVSIPFEPLCDGVHTETKILVKCDLGHVFDRSASYLGSVCPICSQMAKQAKIQFMRAELPEEAGFEEWAEIWHKKTGIRLMDAPSNAWSQTTHLKVTARCWCGRVWEPSWQDVCQKRIASCGCLTRFSQASEEIYQFLTEAGVTVAREHPLENLQIDMYLPAFKIAIEYNGLRWHRGNQDLKKYNLCNRYGLRYVGIYEDEWVYKKKACKGFLANLANLKPNDRKQIKSEDTSIVVQWPEINEFIKSFGMVTIPPDFAGGLRLSHDGETSAVFPFHIQDENNVIFDDKWSTDPFHWHQPLSLIVQSIAAIKQLVATGYRVFIHSDNRLGTDSFCRSLGFVPFKELPPVSFCAKGDRRYKFDDSLPSDKFHKITDCGHKLWMYKP